MAQERVNKVKSKQTEDNSDIQDSVEVADSSKREELEADLDGLLDEIDEVLEENAQEFVSNYVQKGGE